ncbi:hypothetical protein BH20CHL6_BH20CHL6_19940 [soil metagenome]
MNIDEGVSGRATRSGTRIGSRATRVAGAMALAVMVTMLGVAVSPAMATSPATATAASDWEEDRPAGSGFLHGIDVSKWQGELDYAAAAKQGLRFVFARATYGNSLADPLYKYNRREARAHGLQFGAYHFARPDLDPGDAVNEADFFLDTARPESRDLLPVLDLETTGKLSQTELRRWISAFVNRIHERIGVRPIIYTGGYMWRTRTGDWRGSARSGHALWIAHWGASKPSVPAANWDGNGYRFWQWTDCGRVGTSTRCVDYNVFRGTRLRTMKIWANR